MDGKLVTDVSMLYIYFFEVVVADAFLERQRRTRVYGAHLLVEGKEAIIRNLCGVMLREKWLDR